jgi:hypothetical protein
MFKKKCKHCWHEVPGTEAKIITPYAIKCRKTHGYPYIREGYYYYNTYKHRYKYIPYVMHMECCICNKIEWSAIDEEKNIDRGLAYPDYETVKDNIK